MIIYSKAKNFSGLWEKYIELVEDYNFDYPITKTKFDNLSKEFSNYAEIKIGLTIHEREGKECKLYHMFLNFS